MLHTKNHAHHILHYLKNKEMDELYVSVALRNLAISLISIFVPIYLWQLGYRIPDIALFYLVDYSLAALLMPFGMLLCAKYGIKKAMAIGLFISIFYYLAIDQIGNGFPMLVAAVLGSISGSIYWAGFHFEFTNFSDRKEEGVEISFINICAVGAASLSPLIGALLIAFESFNATFITAAIVLALAIVPLFFTKDMKGERPSLNLRNIVLFDRPLKGLPYLAEGVVGICAAIFWPLLIYFSLGKVISLGSIMTGASILTVFLMYIAGRLADRKARKLLNISAVFYAFSWIFRGLFLTLPGIIFNQAYATISSTFTHIPLHKIIYQNAKDGSAANYLLFREFYLAIGRAILLVLAIFLQDIRVLFVLAFIATFLYRLPARIKNKK